MDIINLKAKREDPHYLIRARWWISARRVKHVRECQLSHESLIIVKSNFLIDDGYGYYDYEPFCHTGLFC